MMKKIFFLLSIMSISHITLCQTIYMNSSQKLHILCEGKFECTNNNKYGNNEEYILTFQAPKGNALHVYFADFGLHSSDFLKIYDGLDTNAPLIGNYTNTELNFKTIHSSFQNTNSALTFHFKSDGQNEDFGWIANFNCTKQCQSIIPSIDQNSPTPLIENSFFNLCLGNTLNFSAKNLFPENNMYYHQSDDNVLYQWDMGDGTTYNTKSITHKYTEAKGYNVSVIITDTNQCISNKKYFIAKVSKLTLPEETTIDPICSNTPKQITIGSKPNYDIVFPEISFLTNALTLPQYSDTLFLPDKSIDYINTCGELTSTYKAIINFSEFPKDATLKNYQDIRSICLNMEQSHMSTIDVKLFCPNGKNTTLLSSKTGTLQLQMLGEPYGAKLNDGTYSIDEARINDNQYYSCDRSYNPAGKGYTYCFASYNDKEYNPIALDENYSQSSDYFTPLDSSNKITKEYYYYPESVGNTFKSLEGCPLNGKWYIEVGDNYSQHNGYLFSWNIEFSKNVLPVDIQNTNTIDTVEFTDNNNIDISSINDTSFTIFFNQAGTQIIDLTAYDNAGCSDNSKINLNILETPTFKLNKQLTLCEGEEISIEPINLSAKNYLWNTGQNTPSITINEEGLYILTASNTYENIQCSSSDSTYVKNSICQINIPNVVTPNGDKINDLLEFKNLEQVGTAKLTVYNRWGTIVFESNNYQNDWYPSTLSSGTYYFILIFNDPKFKTLTGNFAIIMDK